MNGLKDWFSEVFNTIKFFGIVIFIWGIAAQACIEW